VPDNLLIHPNGDMYQVPQESMQQALDSGYTVPSPDQVNEFANDQKYGEGTLQSATAFGQGVVEGGLPFVGNYALGKLEPGYQEVAEQLKERHPIAHVAGEITGIVADPLGIFGLLGTGGKVAEKSIAAASKELGAGALGQIAAKAAGYGVEGAGFGVAHVANDLALGDPSLTAEKAISEIGYSALLSAGLGLGVGAAGVGASKAVDAFDTGGAFSKIKQSAIRKFAQASSLVNGQPVDDIIMGINQGLGIKTVEDIAPDTAKWDFPVRKNWGPEEEEAVQAAPKGLMQQGKDLVSGFGVGLAAKAVGIPTPIAGAIGAAYSALKDPVAAAHSLVKLQELVSGTSDLIASGARALVNASPLSGSEIAGYTAAKLSNEKYKNITDQVQNLANNPEALVEHMSRKMGPLSTYAPTVAGMAHTVAAAATSFLASKVPQKPPTTPLQTQEEPSQSEIFNFSQYYNAINNPTSILKSAKNGTLTQQQVEAVKAVYPRLFGEMQKAITEEVVSKKNANKIPYQHKLMISMFTGHQSDSALSPLGMGANQLALGASQLQQEAKNAAFIGVPKQQRTRVSGLNKLDLSQRNLTPTQAVNQRSKP
jgi:hypothetical protein